MFEEISLEEDTPKNYSKMAYVFNKLGNFKEKIINNSSNFYNYLYSRTVIDFEKEYNNIMKIIASSMNLKDNLNNPDLSYSTLIQQTLEHLVGLNKELNEMKEKPNSIYVDEKKLIFKKNEFSEIIKSYLRVNKNL